MSGVLFLIVLLIVVINVIGNAVNRAQQKGEAVSRINQEGPVAKIRRAGMENLPEKKQIAGVSPPAELGKGKQISAPLQLSGSGKIRVVHNKVDRIFREEEELLAAFIFHEILGPPRSLRRR